MLDELRELYQEVILDHGKSPRNRGKADPCTHRAAGHNPICGDTLVLTLGVDGDKRILDARFEGRGCAISIASASIMTEILKGKTVKEAERLFEAFHALCTGDDEAALEIAEKFGLDEDDVDRLSALSGVRAFPMRVKCATLAWHAFEAAVRGEQEATTE